MKNMDNLKHSIVFLITLILFSSQVFAQNDSNFYFYLDSVISTVYGEKYLLYYESVDNLTGREYHKFYFVKKDIKKFTQNNVSNNIIDSIIKIMMNDVSNDNEWKKKDFKNARIIKKKKEKRVLKQNSNNTIVKRISKKTIVTKKIVYLTKPIFFDKYVLVQITGVVSSANMLSSYYLFENTNNNWFLVKRFATICS